MRPSRAARQPRSRIPRSDWASPRRGACPRTVTSSAAPTIARSASIIGRGPAPGGRDGRAPRARERVSAGLSRRRLLHETQAVLDLLFFLVHFEEPQVLFYGGADSLLQSVSLYADVLEYFL